MKPFIFNFKETPTGENMDHTTIEYDDKLNLSVIKKTRQPAIDVLDMATETFTKAQGESSDTDKSYMNKLMDTATKTFSGGEESDSDKETSELLNLVDTTTITESSESTDQDK
jgi:hypothetical protein